MKLCYLAGASSVHSHRWISFFVKQGHEITWISTEPNNGSSLAGIDYHEILRPGPRALALAAAVPAVRSIVQKVRPDVLHAHFASSYGVLGLLSGWQPFMTTAWGSDILRCKGSTLRRLVVRRVLNASQVITCDAEHMRVAMTELIEDASRIKIVYFGTDTQDCHPSRRSEALRAGLGVGDNVAVISVRTLAPLYNVETLIRAIPTVLKTFSNTVFVIVGGGPEAGYLKDLAESLHVSSNVRFVGPIKSTQMATYLASSDIYVSTSLQDAGLAGSTAEAMACELPVVVTDSGENRLWVADGENGFVVPVRDASGMADRLITLINTPKMRKTFGQQARITIDTRNSYTTQMREIEALYESLAVRSLRRASG